MDNLIKTLKAIVLLQVVFVLGCVIYFIVDGPFFCCPAPRPPKINTDQQIPVEHQRAVETRVYNYSSEELPYRVVKLPVSEYNREFRDANDPVIVYEHTAIGFDKPASAADWYCRNLDLELVRKLGDSWFLLVDKSGNCMIELYKFTDTDVTGPCSGHLGFSVNNVEKTRERMREAGAFVKDIVCYEANGDCFFDAVDPWGNRLQFMKRVCFK